MNNVLHAYKLAADLHAGQVDKLGRPYIEHLTRVMLRVQAAGGDLDQQIAALLHDAVEDHRATPEQLAAAGVPDRALALVAALTKPAGIEYDDYVRSVRAVPHAQLVKKADLDDNSDPARLALLPPAVAERLHQKYTRARRVLEGA